MKYNLSQFISAAGGPVTAFSFVHLFHHQHCLVAFNLLISLILLLIFSLFVDKCPINPHQQLLYFQHIQDSNFMLFTPTHFQKYKIQRTSLQSAEFKLTLSRRVKLEDFCLQLEITDGPSRLQQIR